MMRLGFDRAWAVLRDSLLLGLVRSALSVIQTATDLLRLDRAGREAILAQLRAMLLAPAEEERTETR
ncbi:MAG: hypothetical protein NZ555_00245 [Geminicoccaceae bacterium]|nr:hypothetical protein [Geminicoccaceae bacterium]MCX8100432.1 hypothetical protein [Geminicoccaceae bacterium]MDW8371219.1 hypothetical protein [Geminicoccaceae bacterium]